MNILFYRYGNICEPDLIEQFSKIGFGVQTIEEEITNKKITPARRVELINDKLSLTDYAFVFSINFFPSVSDVCEIYQLPYVCWTVDAPIAELFSKSITNSVNRIFVFDRAQEEQLKNFTDNVSLLPLATNVERWDSVIKGISRDDVKKYSGDISFVGSLYTDNDPLKGIELGDFTRGFLEGLYRAQSNFEGINLIQNSLSVSIVAEIKKSVPGYFEGLDNSLIDLSGYIAAHSVVGMHYSSIARIDYLNALSKSFDVDLYTRSDTSGLAPSDGLRVKGGVATLTEMPKVFNLSKINLNMSIYPIENGLPLRIWDVLGCRGFLLTNYRENLLDYFEPGVDLDYFSDSDELVEKCRFYLEHDEIREKIKNSGYEKVRSFHTYMNRMPALIGSVMK